MGASETPVEADMFGQCIYLLENFMICLFKLTGSQVTCMDEQNNATTKQYGVLGTVPACKACTVFSTQSQPALPHSAFPCTCFLSVGSQDLFPDNT